MARRDCPVIRFPLPLTREPGFRVLRRRLLESACRLEALRGTPIVGGMWPVDGTLARRVVPDRRPHLRVLP